MQTIKTNQKPNEFASAGQSPGKLTFDDVVRLLERRGRISYTAERSISSPCPAHDDYNPSLSVSEGKRKKLLIYCHAGCDYRDVLDALVTGGTRQPSPSRPADRVVRTIEYPLFDYDGNLVAIHERRENAKGEKIGMPWRMPDGSYGLKGRPTQSLPLFNGYLLKPDLVAYGSEVYLTEGEKDCTALVDRDIVACATVCGASNTPSDDVLKILCPYKVTYWADDDPIGRLHMFRIRARVDRLRRTLMKEGIGQ